MAPFDVLSLIRYLFIISNFNDLKTKQLIQRSQGLSFIAGRLNKGHNKETERYFDNFGYFGDTNIAPLKELPGELDWATTEPVEPGTTLYYHVGKVSPSEKLLAHAMINYFVIIEREQLVVKIKGDNQNNSFELNKETLPEFFEKHKGILMNRVWILWKTAKVVVILRKPRFTINA